jgi:hypothetical protein
MPANTSPIFELVPNVKGVNFAPADTTTKKTIFTAGSNGSRVDSISVVSNSTALENLAVYINDGATDFPIGNINIAIGAGYTTVAKVEGLQSVALLGYIFLPTGYILKANAVATITAAKIVDVVVQGGDY